MTVKLPEVVSTFTYLNNQLKSSIRQIYNEEMEAGDIKRLIDETNATNWEISKIEIIQIHHGYVKHVDRWSVMCEITLTGDHDDSKPAQGDEINGTAMIDFNADGSWRIATSEFVNSLQERLQMEAEEDEEKELIDL